MQNLASTQKDKKENNLDAMGTILKYLAVNSLNMQKTVFFRINKDDELQIQNLVIPLKKGEIFLMPFDIIKTLHESGKIELI